MAKSETLLNVLWKPYPAQIEFFRRKEDVVLFGGSKGPGKSDALLYGGLLYKDQPKAKAIVLRRIHPSLQEILDRAHLIFPKLGGRWRSTENRFEFPSGFTYGFGHCQHEQDKAKYNGMEFQYIGFDQLEEFTETQFDYISMQARTSVAGAPPLIRASANPGGAGHFWVKRRFIDNKRPRETHELAFPLPNGKVVTRTSVFIPATIYDNPALMEANPTYLANLMSLPADERKAYLEGDWDVFTGQCIFDGNGMRTQQVKVMTPEWTCYIKDLGEYLQPVPDPAGNLNIWREPDDQNQYLIGADVAEGVEGGDYSSAHIVDKRTWEVVAHWHGHIDPGAFGEVLARLGYYYNTAEIAVEWNGMGAGTIQKLRDLHYAPLYRRDLDKYGWRTDPATRHAMLATLKEAILNGTVKVRSQETLDEMYNFIRNPETGKLEAREGGHDDRVMSLAITLQCIRVNPFEEGPKGRQFMSPIHVTQVAGHRKPKRGGYRGR